MAGVPTAATSPPSATFLAGGIATFSFDKAGTGGSTGDWRHDALEGRAAQAAAMLAWLRASDGSTSARVGVWGHSQGGWLAQMLAARDPDLSFASNSRPGHRDRAAEPLRLGTDVARRRRVRRGRRRRARLPALRPGGRTPRRRLRARRGAVGARRAWAIVVRLPRAGGRRRLGARCSASSRRPTSRWRHSGGCAARSSPSSAPWTCSCPPGERAVVRPSPPHSDLPADDDARPWKSGARADGHGGGSDPPSSPQTGRRTSAASKTARIVLRPRQPGARRPPARAEPAGGRDDHAAPPPTAGMVSRSRTHRDLVQPK